MILKRVINIIILIAILCLGFAISVYSSQQRFNYKKGEIIIKLKSTAKAKFGAIKSLNAKNSADRMLNVFKSARDKDVKDISKVYKVRFSEEDDLNGIIKSYRNNPNIEYVELNYLQGLCKTPNDEHFSSQWSLDNTGQDRGIAGCDISAHDAWKIKTRANVIIAVIDTGIYYDHEDLEANIWKNSSEIVDNGIDDDRNGYIDDYRGWNFSEGDNDTSDYLGHGTNCAGVIGAIGNNSLGIAGICWDAKVMPVRIFPNAYADICAQAIIYAVDNGAKILSCSWGGYNKSNIIKDAIAYANNKGAIVLFAAGNNDSSEPFYPAYYEDVVAVAATDNRDSKATFSNFGSWVDVCAPGQNIYSTINNGSYGAMSGTSMSCPMVSGVAGLVMSEYPDLSAQDVRGLIENNADSIDEHNPDFQGMLGKGRVNAFASLANNAASSGSSGDPGEETSDNNDSEESDAGQEEDTPKQDKDAPVPKKYRLGLLDPTPDHFKKLKKLRKIEYPYLPQALPSSVDLSSDCPPVADQGNQGSCVSWSSGYCYKSFQEKQERGWDISLSSHQFSPAFLYSQVNGGQDKGSQIYDTLLLLADKGCSTLDVTPYDENDFTTWPTTAAYESALPYRAKDLAYFINYSSHGYQRVVALTDEEINNMKTHLAGGDIFVMGIPIYSNFYTYVSTNGVFDTPTGAYDGGHAVTVVGYDDSQDSGAFKIRNSWGTSWGHSGNGWLSYDFVKNYGLQAMCMTDRIGYSPIATAKILIDHQSRGDLEVTVGLGDTSSPDWSKIIFNNAGGWNKTNIYTICDISEGCQYLSNSATNYWWVKAADTAALGSGNIVTFEVTYNEQIFSCTSTPEAIPDLGSAICSLSYYAADTSAPTGTPSTPTDDGTHVSTSTISFSWDVGSAADANSGIAGYWLSVSTYQGGSEKFNDFVGTTTYARVYQCKDGKTYYARVAAVNASGILGAYSSWSDGVSVYLGPDLNLSDTDISLSNSTPIKGTTVTISATIHNTWNDSQEKAVSYDFTKFASCDMYYFVDDTYWWAQSFTVSDLMELEQIALYCYDYGATGESLTVDLRYDDGTGCPDESPSGLIETSASTGGAEIHWQYFNFTSTLTADTQYWLHVYNDASATNGWLWNCDISSPAYDNGSAAYSGNSGVSWENHYDKDFLFKLYGKAISVRFYEGDPDSGGAQIGDPRLLSNAINANETAVSSTTWLADTDGQHEIYVRVNYAGVEKDFTNNTASKTITVELKPPSAISNLTALTHDTLEGAVTLEWTAPGDDYMIGTVSGYLVKYSSMGVITQSGFDNATTYEQTWTNFVSGGNAESRIVTGLIETVTYWFAIKGYDEANAYGVWNSSVDVAGINTLTYAVTTDSAPPAPQNVVASAGDEQVTISWDTPTVVDIEYYKVYCDSAAPYDWADQFIASQAVSTSYIHAGLDNYVTYYYRVIAVDRGPVVYESVYSNEVSTCSIPPIAPTGFAGTVVSTGSIRWSWTDNSSNEYGYRVLNDTGGAVITLSKDTESWLETDLNASTSYYRYVETYNYAAARQSNTDIVYTLANPPSNLSIISALSNAVILSWESNNNPSNVRFGVSHSTDSFRTSTTTVYGYSDNLTDTTLTVYSLTRGTSYWFRVWAYNGAQVETDYIQVSTITSTTGTLNQPNTEYTEEVTASDGTTIVIEVPDTAFSTQTITTISLVDSSHSKYSLVDSANSNTNNKVIIQAYEFIVKDIASNVLAQSDFNDNVTIKFRYPSTCNYAQLNHLRIYKLNETTSAWEEQSNYTLNVSSRQISVSVNSFSIYAVMSKVASELEDVAVYPNPFKPSTAVNNTVKIINLPSEATIRIYNIARELVYEYYHSDTGGGITWDGKNNSGEAVATGLYIYVLEDSSGGKKHGKLSVIW